VDTPDSPAEPLTAATVIGGSIVGAGAGAGIAWMVGGRRAELMLYRSEARAPVPNASIGWTWGF
jgi:hypothetical protein